MADNDNRELREFLEKRFDGFEKQFDQLRSEFKAEIAAAKEETMRHTGVLVEGVRRDLAVIGEGVMAINEKMGRDKEENIREHDRLDKRTLINSADISKLDQRVARLERKA